MRNWMWSEALSLLAQAEGLQKEFACPAVAGKSWEPPIDVVESSAALFVHVALPGVPADAIVVGLEPEAVTVAAMRGFPFDVIYADRADPVLLRHMREEARRGTPAVRAA